jgi:hypothetical protein
MGWIEAPIMTPASREVSRLWPCTTELYAESAIGRIAGSVTAVTMEFERM